MLKARTFARIRALAACSMLLALPVRAAGLPAASEVVATGLRFPEGTIFVGETLSTLWITRRRTSCDLFPGRSKRSGIGTDVQENRVVGLELLGGPDRAVASLVVIDRFQNASISRDPDDRPIVVAGETEIAAHLDEAVLRRNKPYGLHESARGHRRLRSAWHDRLRLVVGPL